MKFKKLIIAFIFFQLLIVAGMLIKAVLPLITGKEVLLKVIPRDPRDLFRGDYVQLNYPINNLSLNNIKNDIPKEKKFNYGDALYVELKKADKFFEPVGVWMKPVKNNNICIKGIVEYPFILSNYNNISLNYGIEKYFTDSEKAKMLEEKVRNFNSDTLWTIYVSVMIDGDGNSRIKEIYYEDFFK